MIVLKWVGTIFLAIVIVALLQLALPERILLLVCYFLGGFGLGISVACKGGE